MSGHHAPDAPSRAELLNRLTGVVGSADVLTSDAETRRYVKGFRYGGGPVAAVVRPGSLVEMWAGSQRDRRGRARGDFPGGQHRAHGRLDALGRRL
ncbi:hypothetical protein [Chenggangzhangella methanolivorans]|uniref:hypothetical protein n=1 Tax=Chenggangzhangella methanolivorans TaxID=1437009 RepID=UPI0021BDCC6A|nr:hypothetical protein [Chenggangzhangella methanolivorans]